MVSFPGVHGWWCLRAQKCPRSPRGKAGHNKLHVRAVEAPVHGWRVLSRATCGSGCWRWSAQAPIGGAPWGPGRAIDILGARGPLLRWRFLAVRFRGVTQKQLRFRVIQNGFRPPRSSWRPPHLHSRFYASAASRPRGLCGSTPLVPRSSYPLIPGPAPWCVSLPGPALPRLHCPLPPSVR